MTMEYNLSVCYLALLFAIEFAFGGNISERNSFDKNSLEFSYSQPGVGGGGGGGGGGGVRKFKPPIKI